MQWKQANSSLAVSWNSGKYLVALLLYSSGLPGLYFASYPDTDRETQTTGMVGNRIEYKRNSFVFLGWIVAG